MRNQESPMTADEYREAIERVGLTQVGAAEFFNVADTTSRRWIAGRHPIPDAVAMTLRLMIRYNLTPAKVRSILMSKWQPPQRMTG